ncbi:amino acid adenylation domain-containing protein [Micromonospora sp. PLK6-60]|uniref:non-ribosomal peptide synthetase n=1 Tax=Micromonospora sp. PLK6-60 TaxID=2873383 RepID=UPI001CA6B354|nr:non-ribosomal peptide synthetase [Micromonospora sp. PLK6-60]MBY8870647.1 amino acid adenylation domain-containing protein [Micromonospora sp. PLK6-60]
MDRTSGTTTQRTGPAGLLASSAARWPQRPALVEGERTLSYAELDQAVTRAAAGLRDAGVAPGDRVGLVLGRGTAELIALAALYRRGACFVPVDPAAPDSRIGYVLADAGCIAVVAPRALADRLAGLSARVVPLETLAEATGAVAEPDDPARLAYVIHTSGSTGEPKGVAVAAGAAAEHARLAAGYFGLGPADRLLQFASLGFDVAQEEIWSAWAAGAALVLNPAGLPAAPELAGIVAGHGITVLQLPTAYWRSLLASVDGLDPAAFRSVRLVIIGSEAARIDDLAPWRASPLAHAELVNAYGPTEAVVTATAYRIAPGAAVPATGGGLPIGPAFPGRSAHVLDADGAPVPAGEVGELYLGGLLAEGYVGRPDATRERFVHAPGGDRRYRTGDLVRELAGGVLEFVGRADGQLKLRGYRIEAEEVEAALRRHDGVLAAAVGLVDRGRGEPVLGALLTARGDRRPDPAEVLRTAAGVLPPYMVPAFGTVVAEVPVNRNGKLDRRAVAAELERRYAERREQTGPPPAADAPAAGDAPSGGDALAALLPIWRTVLGVDDLDPDEDFFEAGGDSLLAMQITARARAAGWTVAPADLLAAATVRATAARARPMRGSSPTAAVDATGPVELLPAQLRWLHDGPIPDVDAFVLCALFTVPADLDRQVLMDTARVLLDRHAVLRSRFAFHDDRVDARQVEVRPESVVDVVDLDGGPAADVSARVEARLAEIQRSLSLTDGPVWRLVHLRVPDAPGRLFLVVHHLLLDGWSMSLLVDDLDAAVTSGRRGEVTLPASTAGVREVAAAFAGYVGGDEARRDAKVWRDRPWDEVGPLPYDRHGPGLLTTVRTETAWLGAEDTDRLLFRLDRGVPRAHELLLAAICVALAGWSGRPTQAVDVYTHSRDVPVGGLDLSRTIGYVQATYPHVCTVRGADAAEVVRLAAEPTAPERRYGFDGLRFRSPDDAERATLAALPACPVRLNYRGQLDRIERRPAGSALADADEDPGLNRSPRQRERYQLMFEGDIVDGRLLVGVKYSTDHYDRETVRALVDSVVGLLADTARRLAR